MHGADIIHLRFTPCSHKTTHFVNFPQKTHTHTHSSPHGLRSLLEMILTDHVEKVQ